MAAPYIPPRDPELRVWGVNFATLISALPSTYGLGPADAATIQGVVDAFVGALDAYTPESRNATLVQAKNTAKQVMLGTCRTYASQIRLNPGVANDDKLALGLNLPNNSPTPIPAPETNPLLVVIGATPGSHTLRFADSNTPDKRSKPFGAVAINLYRSIGLEPVTDSSGALFYGSFTKQPVVSLFTAADAGKWCTYFGRWVTRSGPGGQAQEGPFSGAASFIIPAT